MTYVVPWVFACIRIDADVDFCSNNIFFRFDSFSTLQLSKQAQALKRAKALKRFKVMRGHQELINNLFGLTMLAHFRIH